MRSAGHSLAWGVRGTMAALLAAALACGGCRPAGESEGGTYRNRELGFSLRVPDGWTLTELEADLAVRLEGPAGEGAARPVVGVFIRDEYEPVTLSAVADDLRNLMAVEAAVPVEGSALAEPGAPPPPAEGGVGGEPTELGGLPAVSVVRTVTLQTVRVNEQTIVAARGRRVWALVIAVPETAGEPAREAVDKIRRSFTIE